MTEANWNTLINAVSVLLTVIVTYLIKRSNEKTAVIEKKLDENHQQTNGHIQKLLQTTNELGVAQGMAQGKAEGRESQKLDARELKEGVATAGMKIDAASIDITANQVTLGEKKPEEPAKK